MHCVVTAGPTCEPLDKVRRLTNFSTGRLGTDLACFLAGRGHQVTLLIGEQAVARPPDHGPRADRVRTFTSTSSLHDALQSLADGRVDAVFHAAAVSDFGFGKVWRRVPGGELEEIQSGKYSTRLGPLLAELVPTPKLIAQLPRWFPRARLVGWKFEVDGDRAGVIRLAQQQITENRTHGCVANGPAYGAGFGLVRPGVETQHLADAAALFEALETLVRP
jgi:phosphopantothenoylcysteine synthetase/decarboxylase